MESQDTALIIIAAAGILFILIFWIYIPARMAISRERSALGWVLLTWVLSPLWIIILLLILGDSKEKVAREVVERYKRES